MWTPTTRRQHSRAGLRYGSDLTDAEWAVLEPLLPAPATSGRRRVWPMREIVNAIFYILRGGVPWRLIPSHFPPWRTVYRWFARLRDHRAWENINHVLVMQDRERAGREASPTAAVIDSQSVKTTESGGIRGYDAGKKIKGRKRHAMVDTDGRAIKLQVHSAAIQDRDGAGPLLRASRARWPFVQIGYADGGYLGPRVASASSIRIQVVRRSDKQVGFVVLAVAGLLNASLPGSTGIADWQKMLKRRSRPLRPSFTQHPACCCYAGSHVERPIRDRLSGEAAIGFCRAITFSFSSNAASSSSQPSCRAAS